MVCAPAGSAAASNAAKAKRFIVSPSRKALPARMRRPEDRLQEPLRGNLAVAFEVKAAVVRQNLLAVAAPVRRNLPPRHLGKHVVHRVQVVVEEEQAPEEIRLGDRGAL